MDTLTPEREWLSLLNSKPHWHPQFEKIFILSPHPDDETLGTGGLIASLNKSNIDITIVSITNGENAYPNKRHLGKVRIKEQENALKNLGLSKEHIVRFNFTDSAVDEYQIEKRLLTMITEKNSHLFAPWIKDFHPDHIKTGKAATRIAEKLGVKLTYYFFWTWHTAKVQDIRHLQLLRYKLSAQDIRAKKRALECYQSQLYQSQYVPILEEKFLESVNRPFEVFLNYDNSQ